MAWLQVDMREILTTLRRVCRGESSEPLITERADLPRAGQSKQPAVVIHRGPSQRTEVWGIEASHTEDDETTLGI